MEKELILPGGQELKKGYEFTFGTWDNDPIDWLVLKVNKGDVLCISKYLLDRHRFDLESNDWYKSELRHWLNSDFLSKAFSDEEKSFILPYKGDKISLLSSNEAKRVFLTNSDRSAKVKNEIYDSYWLRTPGSWPYGVESIEYYGRISIFGDYIKLAVHVRPLLLLDKKAFTR